MVRWAIAWYKKWGVWCSTIYNISTYSTCVPINTFLFLMTPHVPSTARRLDLTMDANFSIINRMSFISLFAKISSTRHSLVRIMVRRM
jgi:hypothetical protein